jgi:hypothetical protein
MMKWEDRIVDHKSPFFAVYFIKTSKYYVGETNTGIYHMYIYVHIHVHTQCESWRGRLENLKGCFKKCRCNDFYWWRWWLNFALHSCCLLVHVFSHCVFLHVQIIPKNNSGTCFLWVGKGLRRIEALGWAVSLKMIKF